MSLLRLLRVVTFRRELFFSGEKIVTKVHTISLIPTFLTQKKKNDNLSFCLSDLYKTIQ